MSKFALDAEGRRSLKMLTGGKREFAGEKRGDSGQQQSILKMMVASLGEKSKSSSTARSSRGRRRQGNGKKGE